MTSSLVNCPLCCQPAFNSLAALSMSLINVATKSLDCPVCHESLPGLDKFTIHIFGHALSHEISGYKSQQNGVLKLSHVVDHEIGHKSQENALKVVASTSSHDTAHKSLENSISRLSGSEIGVKSQENCVLKLSHLVDHEIGQKSQHHSDLSQNHKVIVKTADQNAPIGLDLAFGKTKIQNPGLPMFIRRIDCSTAKESLVVEKSINFHESQLVTSKTDETVVLENVPNLNEFRLVNRLTTDYVMENASNPIETPPLVGLGNDDNNNNKDEKMIGNFDNRMSNSSCGRNNVTNDNCGNNYINRESGSITDNNCWNIDTNRDRVSSMSNKAFVTDVGNLIGTKDDDVTSKNSMEGIVTVTDKNFDNSILSSNNGVAYTDDKIDKNFDNSILSSNNVVDVAMRCDIVTNQTDSSSRNENDTHLISFNEDTCVGSTKSNSMTQEADNDIEAECNSVTKIDDSSVCDYGEYGIIQEGDNGVECDSMKNTDDSTPSYNVLNSDNILEYSEDSSNDLLKNLEPFIKYSAENVGRKIRKQNLVEENSENVDLSMKESEETSSFENKSNNLRGNDSNFVEKTCDDVSTFLKGNEVNIIERNESSISDTSMEFSNTTSAIHQSIVVKEIFGNHLEVIPMLFESQSNCTLKNDASTSKTKSPRKDLRRKICKKLLDSAMTTTQGVQTMEESFTKNNNPFGKFANFDRNSEEFLDRGEKNMESYERNMESYEGNMESDERNMESEERNMESYEGNMESYEGNMESDERNLRFDGGNLITEERNLISDRTNLISVERNVLFDGGNPVSDEKNNVFYMKIMDSDEATFENSTNSVENSGTVVCDLCLFTFPDQNILQMHKKLVHSDCDEQKKTFSCHLCSKSFNMRGSLMVHRRVAHPVLSGGQVSLRNIERIKEMKASSSFDETTPQFTCKTCGKSFKKEQHLTQHERTHEVKQWNCDICSKVFSTKYFLKKHKRLHTGEMPYTCATCGKSFTFQQSYHKHLLYHSDEKPHVCVECGRAFKELSTLHNHQRIHTGEKPFACETCGKCFRQRVSYLVHRRIHTGVMPYKCTVCNKSFRYKVSERTHKCLNATQGHVVDRMSEVVEKLQKLEGTNSNLYLSSSKSNTSTCGSSHTTTPPCTTTSNDTKTENSSTLQPDLNHSVHGVTPLEPQPPCDKMDEGGQEYWTEIPKTTYRNTSPNDNIFTADSSDDFLSFVLTPTFSPSEQFQNLTLSPDSVQDRDRGADGTRNTEQGIKDDDNFETINQQSLKELLDNVDGL